MPCAEVLLDLLCVIVYTWRCSLCLAGALCRGLVSYRACTVRAPSAAHKYKLCQMRKCAHRSVLFTHKRTTVAMHARMFMPCQVRDIIKPLMMSSTMPVTKQMMCLAATGRPPTAVWNDRTGWGVAGSLPGKTRLGRPVGAKLTIQHTKSSLGRVEVVLCERHYKDHSAADLGR